MKKIYSVLFLLASSLSSVFAQVNLQVIAPVGNGATTQTRAPNGNASHACLRGCFLVKPSELTALATGTNVTSMGFTLTTGVTGVPVTGSFTLYLQNTADIAYLKGTNYATAITGMSTVYNGNMTVPVSAGTTSINLTLAPTFTYTGGGIYVAYDWACAGPYSSGIATYAADNTMATGGASASTTITPAPNTLAISPFRPCFIFGAVNSATNDVQVTGIIAPGKVVGNFNTPQTVKAIIKNASNAALTNIPINLNIGGANTFASSLNIASLAAGASATITFPSYTPLVNGLSTISVSAAPDQNNLNNLAVYNQSVTCDTWSQNEPTLAFTSAVGFNTASGIIASQYINPITSTLNAIGVVIGNTSANAGNSVYAVLMNSGGVIQATTNTITLNASMFNTLQTFTLTPQTLAPGTYYLGLAQPANTVTGYFPVAASPAPFVPTTIYYTSILTGGFVGSLTQNLGYFDIEGIFAQTTTISATAPSSIVCSGAPTTLTASGASSYTWSTGPVTSTIVVSPTVVTTYSVVGSNSMGCLANASVSMAINPSPTVTAIGSSTSVCPGSSVSLTAAGANTYSWSTGATSTVTTANPTVATTYSVVGTSTIGCSSTGTVFVAMNVPLITINSPTAICKGVTVNMSANGANSYTWSTGSTAINIIVSPSVTTSYSVSGTSSVGCIGSQTLNLIVNPNPTITVSASPTVICAGETTSINATGTTSYTFYAFSVATSFTAPATGTIGVTGTPSSSVVYTVVGTNSVGCSHTVTVNQTVNPCVGIHENPNTTAEISIFPNPNNGVFMIEISNSSNVIGVEIFNVLGAKIKTQKINSGKNTIDLQDQSNGIYFINLIENNKTISVSKMVKQ